MNKKVVTVGLLAGGIALTGLAGSAYAEGSGSKPATPPKKTDAPSAVICIGTDGPGTGKAGAGGIVTEHFDGKARALPKPPNVPGGKPVVTLHNGKTAKVAGGKAVTVVRDKNGHTTVVVGKPPKVLPPKGAVGKGVTCTTVKPGTPGAPPSVPPLPSR